MNNNSWIILRRPNDGTPKYEYWTIVHNKIGDQVRELLLKQAKNYPSYVFEAASIEQWINSYALSMQRERGYKMYTDFNT
jgi:hypothetical protein